MAFYVHLSINEHIFQFYPNLMIKLERWGSKGGPLRVGLRGVGGALMVGLMARGLNGVGYQEGLVAPRLPIALSPPSRLCY